MSFYSPIFLFCFLPVIFILYRISKNNKYRNILLAAASLIFYAFGQIEYVLLLLFSITLNYLAGLALRKKKSGIILACAVLLNILILCIFKFAVELGINDLTMPLGISFFTFQGLSYVIDTYRNPEYGTENYLKVFLYISFFPRLIAGPIVKYHEIESELLIRDCNADLSARGIEKFVTGFCKKMLIAEPMAQCVEKIMSEFSLNGVSDFRLSWLFAIAYMIQIYFDFSGYSDMAIGIGEMFGFHFPENFNLPYGSFSIKEFWRKWHISLSSWFKEYVYIPLGGNRKGKARAMFNRITVFILTGVWHGANFTYLIWGIGHGLLSSLEDIGIIPVKKLENSKTGKSLLKLYTLLSVCLLFVIFRCESLTQAFAVIAAMFSSPAVKINNLLLAEILTPAFLLSLVSGIVLSGNAAKRIVIKNTTLRFALCLMGLVVSILAMAKGNSTPFIYAQF